MMMGKINYLRGNYGFIAGSDGQDYFFLPKYTSSIDHRIASGDTVLFMPKQAERGPRATSVRVTSTPRLAAAA